MIKYPKKSYKEICEDVENTRKDKTWFTEDSKKSVYDVYGDILKEMSEEEQHNKNPKLILQDILEEMNLEGVVEVDKKTSKYNISIKFKNTVSIDAINVFVGNKDVLKETIREQSYWKIIL